MNYRHSLKPARNTKGQDPKPPLSPENRDKMVAAASCKMVVKFTDNNVWSKWSNEWQQRSIVNINDAINVMFRIVASWPQHRVESAAIFDTRLTKTTSAENKIWQYEKGFWEQLKPITW